MYCFSIDKGGHMFSVGQTVLLLIDVQGRLAQVMHGRDHLFNSLEILIQGMNILGVPVLWMEQIPEKLGPTIDPLKQHLTGQKPIAKNAFSCCGEPAFMDEFNRLGRPQVVLTGIETHVCICQTGIDLMQQGCQVQVVADCVSSRTKENKEIGLQRLVHAGAQMTSVEMLLFELMKAAQGEKFRQVVQLIK
jgi:hypothetical protein